MAKLMMLVGAKWREFIAGSQQVNSVKNFKLKMLHDSGPYLQCGLFILSPTAPESGFLNSKTS
jgi:CHDNT (NUC034) domain